MTCDKINMVICQSGIKLLDVLGYGSFGTIIEAFDVFVNKRVIVKVVVDFKESMKERILREPKIHTLLLHENILKMYWAFMRKNNLVMVLEHWKGMDLYDYLSAFSPLTEEAVFRIIFQIIKAVDYLHSNCIVHRDLKPENIIIKQNLDIKICDFGLSCICNSEGEIFEYSGTMEYLAPEIIKCSPYFGFPADMFGIGALLYRIVYGNTLLRDSNHTVSADSFSRNPYLEDKRAPYSLINLIKRQVSNDVSLRYSSKEIFKDPWIYENYRKYILKTSTKYIKNEENHKEISVCKNKGYTRFLGFAIRPIVNFSHGYCTTLLKTITKSWLHEDVKVFKCYSRRENRKIDVSNDEDLFLEVKIRNKLYRLGVYGHRKSVFKENSIETIIFNLICKKLQTGYKIEYVFDGKTNIDYKNSKIREFLYEE